jgi:hypothetical protein
LQIAQTAINFLTFKPQAVVSSVAEKPTPATTVSPAQAEVVPPSWPMRRDANTASRSTSSLPRTIAAAPALMNRDCGSITALMVSSSSIRRPQASWVGVTHTGSTELSMSGVSALRPRFFTAVVEPNSSIICAMRPDRPASVCAEPF